MQSKQAENKLSSTYKASGCSAAAELSKQKAENAVAFAELRRV